MLPVSMVCILPRASRTLPVAGAIPAFVLARLTVLSLTPRRAAMPRLLILPGVKPVIRSVRCWPVTRIFSAAKLSAQYMVQPFMPSGYPSATQM